MTEELKTLFTIAEQAMSTLGRYNGGDNEVLASSVLKNIQRKLEQNICIPKGANRHPYADVLHEWIEGAEIEGKPAEGIWMSLCNASTLHQDEYRIKPSEPVFEYQFVYIKADSTAEITQFYTDEESKDCHQWTKLEETKRERKL